MSIGKRIGIIRKENNLTLESFGKSIDVSDSCVYRWEHDETNITFEHAIAICKKYNVQLNWLAGL